ncbi:MAG: HNH endonuclease [Actinobacteria bacterium]|nr:HNH endonuclease [Actinomycetota bacterium]
MTHTAADLLEKLTLLGDELGAVLSEALSHDVPRAMTDASVLHFACIIESLGAHLDAARLAAAGEFDDRSRPDRPGERLCAQRGCASAAELLSRATRVTLATAKDRVRMSRLVATRTALSGNAMPAAFPAIRAALDVGEIGLDAVSAITRALGPIADRCHPSDLAASERELVAAATGRGLDGAPPCNADDTRIQAKVWALALDPDGTLPEYERAMRQRALVFDRERDGVVRFRGAMLPDVAAQFRRIADAQCSPRVDGHTSRPSFRDDADHEPLTDDRTHPQKLHDVLAMTLDIAARAAEMPSLGGSSPALLVTITASELERHDGVAFIDGTDTALPAFVARHVACCGGVQRLVLGDDGRIIQLGGPQRTFTAAQRRAITARDGGCVIPGCHTPATWCEIHHDVEHARGGPTHTDNGVMLCWYHHRTLETSGWAVRMVDGVPHTRAPAWIDSSRTWRPAAGSMLRQRERIRRSGT